MIRLYLTRNIRNMKVVRCKNGHRKSGISIELVVFISLAVISFLLIIIGMAL